MSDQLESLTESAENYLKTIARLCDEHGHAHVVDIAKALQVKKPSVTAALSHLHDVNLIEYKTYTPVTLTPKGKVYASHIIKKSTTISQFLTHFAGLDTQRAIEAACLLEHWVSDEEIELLQSKLSQDES